ncbi:hypothetical protein [Nocardia mangyaensis]|uniref:hypothetical protein n=1 Tax=Nocardia mangyaensis TaxID=2213200 RepID=UPI0026773F44|nr:hypothetical protein [Nocardia mangyaensis]MDO3648948.1 hypothetical protein [Nocardia mangyaensis]
MTSGGAPRPATVFYPSVPRLVLMIVGSSMFTVIGIWIALSGDMPMWMLIAIAVCILFFIGSCCPAQTV